MFLHLIDKAKWKLYGLGSSVDRCEPFDNLEILYQNFRRDVEKMTAILDRAIRTSEGPRCFPSEISHQIDENNSIWQFTAGRLRLLWFYDEGRLIICTNSFIKKGQKTPGKEKERAIRLKRKYFNAKKNNTLTIIDDEE